MTWNALVVGLGQIGMGYDLRLPSDTYMYSHARAFSRHPRYKLVGAVDPSEERRHEFENTFHVKAFASVQEAFDAGDVNVLAISTPTKTHFDILHQSLKFGNPNAILCEKPLAYSLDEARDMVELCANRSVKLYVNYMRRSEPGAMEVGRRIAQGEMLHPVKGVAWYSKGFLHNGSHLFNLLEFWLGDVQDFKIVRSGASLADGDGEPDVLVKFRAGDIHFLALNENNFSHNALEIVAANGRLRYDNGGRRIEWSPVRLDDKIKGYKFLSPLAEEIYSDLNRYQWHVAEQLANALAGKPANLCEAKQALQTLCAMHAILESRS